MTVITTREFILTSPIFPAQPVLSHSAAPHAGTVPRSARFDCDTCGGCGTATPRSRSGPMDATPGRRSIARPADTGNAGYCGAGTWA